MATKRGPKPKSVATARAGKPKPPVMAIPDHLEGRVREEFARVAAMLEAAGKLEGTDVRLIELYAINYDLVRKAQEELNRDGLTFETDLGGMQKHPMIGVLNAGTIRLRGLIADLGASKGDGGSKASDGEGPWAGLLSITG